MAHDNRESARPRGNELSENTLRQRQLHKPFSVVVKSALNQCHHTRHLVITGGCLPKENPFLAQYSIHPFLERWRRATGDGRRRRSKAFPQQHFAVPVVFSTAIARLSRARLSQHAPHGGLFEGLSAHRLFERLCPLLPDAEGTRGARRHCAHSSTLLLPVLLFSPMFGKICIVSIELR